MPTLRRRILTLLSKFNVKVHDLEPGSVVLTRRDGYKISATGPKSWFVSRGSNTKRLPALLSPDTSWRPQQFGSGAMLFTDDQRSEEDEWRMHKEAQDYLAARHVASVLDHYRVNCVFDVGGNIGQYGKQLRKQGFTGRIVSFEPVAATAEKLRRVAEKDPEWFVYNTALGREDRTDSINVVYGSMSSLLEPTDFGNTRYKRFKNTNSEDISVRRLDGIMDEALEGIDDPRPYLKLDTQGYDLEAYAGAGKRVEDFIGLQSEVALMQIYEGMPRMVESINTYEADGFEVTGMYPVTREQKTGRVLEFDCVMVRADSLD